MPRTSPQADTSSRAKPAWPAAWLALLALLGVALCARLEFDPAACALAFAFFAAAAVGLRLIVFKSGSVPNVRPSEDAAPPKVETALRLSEERLQLAVEGAGVGIWDWPDVSTDQIWWADKTYELLGYTPGEIQPTISHFAEMLHPDDSARVIDSLRVLKPQSFARQSEYRLRTKSGEYRWFLSSSVATLAPDESTARVIGAIQDVHERRATDELLRRANEGLRNKSEEMEQILYIVSHDLKSPLVTIHGFAHLLRESALEGFRDEDPLPSIDRIAKAAKHMGALIEDILQFSRIGRAPEETEDVDLAAVIDEQRLALADETRLANCDWEVRAPLPVLRANRTRLVQVMQNLIGNALKYGCDKERNRIVIGFEPAGPGRCQIYVQDFGPGIHPSNHGRVFALFQRLEKRKPGNGLGLAIVKRVMELYQGEARVESALGQGARFILEFPEAMLAAPASSRA